MTNTKIQVGEYVRTTSGFIAKCIDKSNYGLTFDNTVKTSYGDPWDYLLPEDEDITKHSFDIIDLIETGDYVKIRAFLGEIELYVGNASSYVSYVGETNGKKFIELDRGQDGTELLFDTTLIKTIVTHEQFKNMEYKVGGDND